MKSKVETQYEANGYNVKIIKPDFTREERKTEDLALVEKLMKSLISSAK